jgi:hypothetical protein
MTVDEHAVRQHRWWNAKRAWQVVALGLVVAASGWLLLAPIYQTETQCSGGGSSSSTGEVLSSWDTCDPPTSMLAAALATGDVPGLVWLVALPMLLAVPPVFARGRAWTMLSVASAVCLVTFVVLGGFALGPLFVPGASCAVVGASVRQPQRVEATSSTASSAGTQT